MAKKDNFSKQSQGYSIFRPDYPQGIIDYIMSFVKNKQRALDIGTGSGQLAKKISPFFDEVYAIDNSSNQIKNAVRLPNITYDVQPAEKTKFKDDQFDLITVAQAVHWFSFDDFNREIYRLLKKDGLFVILGYALLRTNEDTDFWIDKFYKEILNGYWDEERKHVDEHYKTIPFPYEEIIPEESFNNVYYWNFEQLIGYLNTWSSVQHYIAKNNTNPIDLISKELKISWEKNDKKVTFPLLLRLGRLKV